MCELHSVELCYQKVSPFPDVSFTYLEWLFPVYNFCLVHVYAEADSKHLEYLGSGFTLGSARCGHLISALDLTLKMDKTFKHGECSLFILRTPQGNTFLIFYNTVFKADKNLNNYHKTICHRERLECRHVKLSPEKVYSHYVGDHTETRVFMGTFLSTGWAIHPDQT